MYPVFHVSELEPYHNKPAFLESESKGSERITYLIVEKEEDNMKLSYQR